MFWIYFGYFNVNEMKFISSILSMANTLRFVMTCKLCAIGILNIAMSLELPSLIELDGCYEATQGEM